MKNRYFTNKPKFILLLFAIAILSAGVRFLIAIDYGKTALLYVGMPFLVASVLVIIRDPGESVTWKKHYVNRITDAFIIMVITGIILFEGFVCVVMFMPIYLTVILILFIFDYFKNRNKKNGNGTLSLHIIPLIIIASAFEGISPELSYNREEQITVTRVANINIEDIRQNLVQPMHLQKQRPWFLKLFPMPDKIKAGTLKTGDVHEIHFKYYRWFFTNLHEGRMLLELSHVSENQITTTFLDDTSYIANYLDLKGTDIRLEKLDNDHTRISLTISYNRILDPYWYFAPIESYAISKTADFLISEVLINEHQ